MANRSDDNSAYPPSCTGTRSPLDSAPELNALRLRWRKSGYPQQVERRDRLVKAADDLERIAHLIGGWTEDLTDAKAIAAAENRENQAKAAEKVAVP